MDELRVLRIFELGPGFPGDEDGLHRG